MSNENNNRYGSGRNLWRKVYGYQNNKPRVVEVIDTLAAVTYSLDLNKTIRHRDFFIISDVSNGGGEIYIPPEVLGEYDEGIVSMSYATAGTGSFNFTFTSAPYIVLSVDSASFFGENVNIHGFTYTTTGFTFGTSAPFVGTIRYRAIYSPTYPAYCTSSFTSSITASAGSANPGGLSYYTASFDALPGAPFSFRDTAWDSLNRQDVDVKLQPQTSSSSDATVEISSPMGSEIHFIAFY